MGLHQYLAVVLVSCTFKEGGVITRNATSLVSVEDLNMLFFQIGSNANALIEELRRGFHFYDVRPDIVLTVRVASANGIALNGQGISEAFTLRYLSGDKRSLYVVMNEEMRKQILDYLTETTSEVQVALRNAEVDSELWYPKPMGPAIIRNGPPHIDPGHYVGQGEDREWRPGPGRVSHDPLEGQSLDDQGEGDR